MASFLNLSPPIRVAMPSQDFAPRAPVYPTIRNIAFVGDSRTVDCGTGLTTLPSVGFSGWAQIFGGQRWEIRGDGSQLRFGTSGANTQTVIDNHLAAAIAAAPDAIFWFSGTNDYSALTPAQSAAKIRSAWTAIRAAGIVPIGATETGVAAGDETKSAWLVDLNSLLRTYAAQDGVRLCDWAAAMCGGTDNGVLAASNARDSVHFSTLGASVAGRVLATTIAPYLDVAANPFANRTNISANPTWTGGPPPSSWGHSKGATTNVINSQSYEASTDGVAEKWWRIDHTQGNGTTQIDTSVDTIAAYDGVSFETLVELEVISGSIGFAQLTQFLHSGVSTQYALNALVGTMGAAITATDGIVVLRTPIGVGTSGVSIVFPALIYGGTAVFRIRRMAVYQLP